MLIRLTTFCLILMCFTSLGNTKIVFSSNRNGVKGIYIMNDDGSDVKLLTDTKNPGIPRWSPDGKQIVFSRPLSANTKALFLMNADGTNIQQLTVPPEEGWDHHASFSADGKSILFNRVDLNNKDKRSINVIDLKSGRINTIAKDLGTNFLELSPDGKDIIFGGIGKLHESLINIWIMQNDGGRLRELLPTPPEIIGGDVVVKRDCPRWSPDGKRILYSQRKLRWVEAEDPNRGKVLAAAILEYRIYICDTKGNILRHLNIPKNWISQGCSQWMDNGESVLFSGREIELNVPFINPEWRNGYNIYKYHIASGKTTRLTDHQGRDYHVDWISDDVYAVSPSGKKTIQWGQLKAFLYTRYKTLKTFSSGLADTVLQY